MDLVVLNLRFDLVPPFYFLKWNSYFSDFKRKFAKLFMSFLNAQVPSNFASIFSSIKHNSSVLFQLEHYILWLKAAHQSSHFRDFWVLGSKFVKFLMSILNWQVNSSSIFVSFFIVMTHKSPVNFKLMYFLFWIKASHQSPNFETFKCSDENLPNFSCHFWKRKSVFLQAFYQPWLRSKLKHYILWSKAAH